MHTGDSVEVTLVAEGSSQLDYVTRNWGLSFCLNDKILFDCFHDFSALHRQMKAACIDLNAIEKVIISHDHWDHQGGLWELLDKRPDIELYMPPHLSENTRQKLADWKGVSVITTKTCEIAPQLYILEPLPATLKENSFYEQALIFETAEGLVMLSGCAHPNIVAMVKKAKSDFGQPVHSILGGLHLRSESEEAAISCAQELQKEGVQNIAPLHCTGASAQKIFANIFGAGFRTFPVGTRLSFPEKTRAQRQILQR